MRLIIESGPNAGQVVELGPTSLRIGREPDNDVFLNDPQVSRYHAVIALQEGAPVLTDLGSTNGTYVDDRRLSRPHSLHSGERIRIGVSTFSFQAEAEEQATVFEPDVPSAPPPRSVTRPPRRGWLAILSGILVGAVLIAAAIAGSLWVAASRPVALAPTPTVTPSAVVVVEPTLPPTPTSVPATATTAPSPSPTPSPSETPRPTCAVEAEALHVRSGPGVVYDVLGYLHRGDTVNAQARDSDSRWLSVQTETGTQGWIAAGYVDCPFEVSTLPIEPVIPPTPTATQPLPTDTPAAPTPASAASPTPAQSSAIADEIDRLAGGQHGTLPSPSRVGGGDLGGQAEVQIINDNPYELTLLLSGPAERRVVVEPCTGCSVYQLVGPTSCPTTGRPRTTIRLPSGLYRAAAQVNRPNVIPFLGNWTLDANAQYESCFFIVRSL